MPIISPETTAPPALGGLSREANPRHPVSALPLSVGESLEATIVAKTGSPKYANEASTASLLNDYLRIYLSHPEDLLDIFQKGREVVSEQLTNEFYPESTRDALNGVVKRIDSLLCSPNSLKNILYLKDYIANVGLLMEGQWRAMWERDGAAGNLRPADSLKSVLIKLVAELQSMGGKSGSLNPEELQQLTRLAHFTEASVKAIETQQMINVYAQENDNKYLLQIPLLFPDGVRTGEIFIDLGKKGKEKEGLKKSCHVVMFLTMDQLGDLMVDASLSDGKIGCVFKFADPDAQAFASPFLAGLGEALRRVGYACEFLTCTGAEDLTAQRHNLRRETFEGGEGINVFA